MTEHHRIDYDTFLPRLVAALRRGWEEVRAQRAEETFFLFGIETDADLTDLHPLSKSLEQNAAEAADAQCPVMKWELTSDLCRAGEEHTRDLAEEVNRYVFEDHRGDPDGAFEARKARLLDLFENALMQLDAEGFFGAGRNRHKILLRISFGDPGDDDVEYMHEAMKRLNPSQSMAEYLAALQGHEEKETAKRRQREQEGQPIKEIAIAFLRGQQRTFERCWNAHRSRLITPFVLDVLGEREPPEELWEVWFDAAGEPNGRLHGPGQLAVYVIPTTGKCVIIP